MRPANGQAGAAQDGTRPGGPAPVLYAIACGSPVASYLGRLVGLAQHAGWQVWVITTPDGRKFIDTPGLTRQSGHPVRSEFRRPGDPDILPPADAIVVAPATVNTVNKWACGIADTLALGLLVEAYGLGVPIVAMPYTNTAMAVHPTFRESLRRLRSWGVRVLFGEHVMAMPDPGAGTGRAGEFPWQLALAELGPPRTHPGPPQRRGQPGTAWLQPRGKTRLSPPAAPRPAPALLRQAFTGAR